jgi:hypothetical protein
MMIKSPLLVAVCPDLQQRPLTLALNAKAAACALSGQLEASGSFAVHAAGIGRPLTIY